MLYRFNSLFHYAVISSNNQYNNVSDEGATSSHCRECRVTRSVKESYCLTRRQFHFINQVINKYSPIISDINETSCKAKLINKYNTITSDINKTSCNKTKI